MMRMLTFVRCLITSRSFVTSTVGPGGGRRVACYGFGVRSCVVVTADSRVRSSSGRGAGDSRRRAERGFHPRQDRCVERSDISRASRPPLDQHQANANTVTECNKSYSVSTGSVGASSAQGGSSGIPIGSLEGRGPQGCREILSRWWSWMSAIKAKAVSP